MSLSFPGAEVSWVRSVLGPKCLDTFKLAYRWWLLKFADDTKLVAIVFSESEVEQLRSDLKRLYDWSLDWQMLFNTEKCKSLNFGYRNAKSIYSLGGDIVKTEAEEKDLGIIVAQTLKVSVLQQQNLLIKL